MQPFNIKTFHPKPGITLIEASAGTGKTYSITDIITELIASGQCKIDEILVLTFTNAATAELKERIRISLQKASRSAESAQDSQRCRTLSDAVDGFDNAVIQTIHGFCQRTLHEFSIECALSVEFEVLKETREFDKELRHAVIRTIQRESESQPVLIPFCSWLGFEEGYIEKILSNRHLLTGMDSLSGNKDTPNPYPLLAETLDHLKKTWLSERDAIRESLLQGRKSPLYSQKKYVAKNMQKSFQLFDRWADKNILSPDLFKTLDTYATRTLSENLKKNASLPDFRFFDLCEIFPRSTEPLLFHVLQIINKVASEQLETLNLRRQQLRYDDLLDRLASSLETNPILAAKLRKRYRFGLIDEFQDTDPVQFDILSRIFVSPLETTPDAETKPRPLILIGDPKQAIYSFRGGDIFTYHKAKKIAVEQYVLTTNWRSAPEINEAVNTLLQSENAPPFVFPWLEYEPVQTAQPNEKKAIVRPEPDTPVTLTNQSGVHFRELPESDFTNQNQIIRQLVRDVEDLLGGGYQLIEPKIGTHCPLQLSDIAILVSSNVIGAKIRKEFAKAGIQATLSGGASVLETNEAKDWYQILSAILSPKRPTLIKGALSTAPFAFNTSGIMELETDAEKWNEVMLVFGDAHECWVQDHLTGAIALLKNHFAWNPNLSRGVDPLRALANHNHILELLLGAQLDNHFQPAELLDWLKRGIQTPDATSDTELLRLERDSQSVNILTAHKSKGLQFPIVFLPFAFKPNEKRDLALPFSYHDKDGEIRCLYSDNQLSSDAVTCKQDEMLSETLRLLYVAITRTEYLCTIYLPEKASSSNPLHRWIPSKGADSIFPGNGSLIRDRSFLWSRLDPSDQNPDDHDHLKSASPAAVLNAPPDPPEKPTGMVQWSFTGMIRSRSEFIEPGTDEISLFPDREEGKSETENSDLADIHHFEKGTHAGLFFHTLLQKIDFQKPYEWRTSVPETLSLYGFQPERWTHVILEMLENLVSLPFPYSGDDIHLRHIPKNQLFRETEFTFPLGFCAERYEAVRQTFEAWQQGADNPCQLPPVEITGSLVEGYMKGVIDMWFEQDGKIYLVDWKSNWLGTSAKDYTIPALTTAMNEHHYHLQYLLYTCALLRYLTFVRPGFDYDHDFVGAYYVFLRGVGEGSNSIFHAKPPYEIVRDLNRCFLS
jgi:exodeoxyribonuclease V beta subunit